MAVLRLYRGYATSIYAPSLRKEQVKDMDRLQTIIKSLVEVGDRLGRKPVLATGNVHYPGARGRNYQESLSVVSVKGAMVLNNSRAGEDANSATKAHLRTTNEMLDEFAFLGEDLSARKIV